jgi:hypothetical protein
VTKGRKEKEGGGGGDAKEGEVLKKYENNHLFSKLYVC